MIEIIFETFIKEISNKIDVRKNKYKPLKYEIYKDGIEVYHFYFKQEPVYLYEIENIISAIGIHFLGAKIDKNYILLKCSK